MIRPYDSNGKNHLYKLSPSDFAYLWEECKFCYYQKIRNGVSYSGVFPAMFGRINNLLQNSIMGQNLRDIHPELPSGIISVQEGFMKSKVLPGTNCFLSGRFDILTVLDDGTHAIIDFKITTPDEEKIQKYKSQLHAYKYALENPDNGDEPRKISIMGVVSIKPDEMKLIDGKIVFTTIPTWHHVKYDKESFEKLITEISEVLNGDLPTSSKTCKLCIYRSRFESPLEKGEYTDIPF